MDSNTILLSWFIQPDQPDERLTLIPAHMTGSGSLSNSCAAKLANAASCEVGIEENPNEGSEALTD